MSFKVGDTWRTRHGLLVKITDVSEDTITGTFSPNIMHTATYYFDLDGTYRGDNEILYDLVEKIR